MSYKLSICVPLLPDYAAFIDEILGMLALQTGGNKVEVILLDYGINKTNENKWQSGLPSTWRHIHRGSADTPDQLLLQCLSLARGEYCWILNGCDLLGDGAISRIFAELDKNSHVVLLNRVVCDIWLKPLRRDYALNESEGDRIFSLQKESDWTTYLEQSRSLTAVFGYQAGVVFQTEAMKSIVSKMSRIPDNFLFAIGLTTMMHEIPDARLSYVQQAVIYDRITSIIAQSGKLGEQIAADFMCYYYLANHTFHSYPKASSALINHALRGSYPWVWSDLRLGINSWVALREKLVNLFGIKQDHPIIDTHIQNTGPGYVFYQLKELLTLQVHNSTQSEAFMQGDVSDLALVALRHERTRIHGVYEMPVFDLLLVRPSQKAIYNLMAVFVDDDGIVHFPATVCSWSSEILVMLANMLQQELGRMQHNELRMDAKQTVFPVDIGGLHSGRAIPCLADYTTIINHIKRYRFAELKLHPGRVLDCACGVGYGASIMVQNPDVTEYVGVDLDDGVTLYSGWLVHDTRCSFHQRELADLDVGLFENVVSLETIEHVPDPDAFLADLSAKLAPGGQLILSLPVERWAGTHMNPHHLTNWNYRRFNELVERHFEECTIYRQKLSLLGPDTFSASEILYRQHMPDEDEGFIAVLKRPRLKNRHRIFVRRRFALGDVLMTTPILGALRKNYPESVILFSTDVTQAYQNNPNVDVLGNMELQPRADDLLIDLDGCYEKYRNTHVLQSYALSTPVDIQDWRLATYPEKSDSAPIIAILRQMGWQNANISFVIGVHMAATSPDRIWPSNYWQEWFEHVLSVPGIGVILVGHGRDYDVNILSLSPDQRSRILTLVNKTNVLMTAAALSLCDFVVAPDSGMVHLASSVGVRTLVMFGMADPSTRLPLDGSGRAVWSPVECRGCLAQLTPDDAPLCRFEKSFCMEAISVESVWTTTTELLSQTRENSWRNRANIV